MKPPKTGAEKKILMYELVHIVEELFPNKRTENPYFETTQNHAQGLPLEEQLLFHKLIHSLTLLNKQCRINPTKQYFATSEEDVVNILHLFKPELAENPRKVFAFYDDLKAKFQENFFTKEQAQAFSKTSKRSTERYLQQLITYDLAQREPGRIGNQRAKYKLKIKEKRKPNPKSIYEEAFEEFEDFKGFIDLEFRQ
jgi:hypothetical protein